MKRLCALFLMGLALGGCAFVSTPNGKGGVWGVGLGDTSELPGVPNVADAAPQAGGIIGGLFGGPAGAAIGTGIGAVVAGAFGLQAAKSARLKGQDEGWDQREAAATIQAPLVQPKGGKA